MGGREVDRHAIKKLQQNVNGRLVGGGYTGVHYKFFQHRCGYMKNGGTEV